MKAESILHVRCARPILTVSELRPDTLRDIVQPVMVVLCHGEVNGCVTLSCPMSSHTQMQAI